MSGSSAYDQPGARSRPPDPAERSEQAGRAPSSACGTTGYPIPSAATTCTRLPTIVRRTWRFGQVDPASERRNPRGRITAWCVQCGELLEVQEEGTGAVIFSGFPHRVPEGWPDVP